jgi:hypothetical protein
MKSRMATLSFRIPAALLAFAALYLWGCRKLNIGTLGEPMEGFIPVLFGSLFFAGACYLTVRALRWPEEKPDNVSKAELHKVLWLLGTLLAFVVLLPVLGFSICTFGLVVGAAKIMEARLRSSLFLAAGVVAVCYLIFVLWLKVPLPSFNS